ncbi:MAG: hypothetical protein JSR36_05375 [Proteobacteria bacterium]|nr:hypothetical protein [Pseudomonadota bacterium]
MMTPKDRDTLATRVAEHMPEFASLVAEYYEAACEHEDHDEILTDDERFDDFKAYVEAVDRAEAPPVKP